MKRDVRITGGLAGKTQNTSGAMRRRCFVKDGHAWGSRYFSRSLSRLAVKAPSPFISWR